MHWEPMSYLDPSTFVSGFIAPRLYVAVALLGGMIFFVKMLDLAVHLGFVWFRHGVRNRSQRSVLDSISVIGCLLLLLWIMAGGRLMVNVLTVFILERARCKDWLFTTASSLYATLRTWI